MSSIEQRIIDRVVAGMQDILITGGFDTDIGTRVEDSRPNWDEASLPAISVFTGTVTPTELVTDDEQINVTREMPVIISAALARLDTAALDAAFARKAIKDIYDAIKTNMRWRDGSDADPLALYTEEVSHVITRSEQTFEITGVEVTIKITYRTSYFSME